MTDCICCRYVYAVRAHSILQALALQVLKGELYLPMKEEPWIITVISSACLVMQMSQITLQSQVCELIIMTH